MNLRCWSAAYEGDTAIAAAKACCETIQQQTRSGEEQPKPGTSDIRLVVMFVAGATEDEHQQLLDEVRQSLQPELLLGCTADSVIGRAKEFEHTIAVTIWACQADEGQFTPMHLVLERSSGEVAIGGWPDELARPWQEDAFLIALGEPFSFPMDLLLERLNEDRPGHRLVGGMASQGMAPGDNRLYLNEEVIESGAIAVLIEAPIELTTVVSQGCRPIGSPMVITKAERNQVLELGGQPALEVLQQLFQTLPTNEQRVIQRGLHLGRVVNEQQDGFEMGDFLIRNVIGVDQEERSITVGDYFRPGQTVQFHLRDEASSDRDLVERLQQANPKQAPAGALLFSCNGRGSAMFEVADHDAQAIANRFEDLPLAGFFAAGEVGPVGSQNYLHGFTACVAMLSVKDV